MENLKKEFIPYEQALNLKELGFDDPCFGWYLPEIVDKGNIPSVILGSYLTKWNKFGDRLSVPLYSQCFKWFREKYNLFCEIQIDKTTEPKFCFDIFQYEHFGNYEKIEVKEWYLYRTQEEVELECLKKLIEIVKNK